MNSTPVPNRSTRRKAVWGNLIVTTRVRIAGTNVGPEGAELTDGTHDNSNLIRNSDL